MSKKKFNYIFDVLFYCFFTIMPILAYVIHLHHFNDATLLSFFQQFDIINTNVIFTSLEQLFGTTGIFPMFDDGSVIYYIFTYMIMINLLHLFVDFILFIPNICHKYLNYFYQKD